MRVPDAFRPRGATWSGEVISSRPGPSGGPSKTHLQPGGGVPRVHRGRSPVPPRPSLFATPRSVHQFAGVAAGAYPLRRPANAWSPGAPALPGPCYWLVASGTPLGWHGGCLAFGLGRGAVRHYCLGGCSAPSVCARHLRPVRGAQAGTWCCVSPVSPFPPACPALCVAGRPVWVSLTLARWYAIPRGLCMLLPNGHRLLVVNISCGNHLKYLLVNLLLGARIKFWSTNLHTKLVQLLIGDQVGWPLLSAIPIRQLASEATSVLF